MNSRNKVKAIDGGQVFRSMVGKMALLTVVTGIIVRIVLMCNITAPEGSGLGLGMILGAFGLGAVNDLCFAMIALAGLWLFCMGLVPQKYSRWGAAAILTILVGAFVYFILIDSWLHEFNRGLAKVVLILLAVKTVSFSLRLLFPKIRRGWTRVELSLLLGIYVIVIYFNAVSEYFFWAEFNVRYNFIAVDYLVYTNEVIGNILESYSLLWPAIGIVVLTVATVWVLFRKDITSCRVLEENRWKPVNSVLFLGVAALAALLLRFDNRFQQTDNSYYNELQANGPYRFFEAFFKNQLDYRRFYVTMPDDEAQALIKNIYDGYAGCVADSTAAGALKADSLSVSRPNIILITVESMSADFMGRYGNPDHLTPQLDSLARESLTFDQCFATGNRTVRGLEAVTLSRPPCAGQSIVKRPDQPDMTSTGEVLRQAGYDSYFFYGGKSYFDNMGPFFAHNGYEVVDIDNYTPDEVTFKNIWGVCDEDAYRKVASTLQKRYAENPEKPIFAHVMTVSNHRPYTYPEGKIDIAPERAKTREGGVRYTDFAIGDFVKQARRTPWGRDAIFVIMADHCASSAGRTELPLEKYHIPAMIHAPGQIAPRSFDKTVSQIDIIPTLLGILGIEPCRDFYGTDVNNPCYEPRAFMATYQDLGYLKDGILTVLSPVGRQRQWRVEPTEENPYNTVELPGVEREELAREAVAYYQTSAR